MLKLSVENEGEGGEEEVDVEELEDVEPFAGGEGGGTLLAANVGALLVNVTPQGTLWASTEGGEKGSWKPEGGKKKVMTAVAREGRLALAIEGGEVVLLEANDGGLVQVGCVVPSSSFSLTISSSILPTARPPSTPTSRLLHCPLHLPTLRQRSLSHSGRLLRPFISFPCPPFPRSPKSPSPALSSSVPSHSRPSPPPPLFPPRRASSAVSETGRSRPSPFPSTAFRAKSMQRARRRSSLGGGR